MFEIRKELDLTYEAVAVLNRIADEVTNTKEGKKPNRDIAEITVKYGLSESEQAEFFQPILKICDSVALEMSDSASDIALYFFKGQNSMSFGSMIYLLQCLSDNSLSLTEDDEGYAETLLFLHLIGKDDISPDRSLSIAEMIEVLNDTDFLDGQRWKMIELFSNFARHKIQAKSLIAAAKSQLEKKIATAKGLLDYCVSKLISGESAVWEYEENFAAHDKHIVTPSVIAFKEVVTHEIYEYIRQRFADKISSTSPVIYYGILCDKLHDKKESADIHSMDNLFAHLKSLTDMTRLRILKELTASPMKGHEIAKAIGITPATVSHHMNELFARNFVSIEKQGASVLYSLNTNAFEHLNKSIVNIFAL